MTFPKGDNVSNQFCIEVEKLVIVLGEELTYLQFVKLLAAVKKYTTGSAKGKKFNQENYDSSYTIEYITKENRNG